MEHLRLQELINSTRSKLQSLDRECTNPELIKLFTVNTIGWSALAGYFASENMPAAAACAGIAVTMGVALCRGVQLTINERRALEGNTQSKAEEQLQSDDWTQPSEKHK